MPISSYPKSKSLFPLASIFLVLSLAMLSGCRSRFVEATIDNQGDHPLQLVEVDYPSASFGTGVVAAHSLYHYRLKVLGSGSVKLSFTDSAGNPHNSSGPELDEGQQGSLLITVDPSSHVHWTSNLQSSQ